MSTAAATAATDAPGVATPAHRLAVGMKVWHRGAFRTITAIEGSAVRMGRYVSRWHGMWEVAVG